jgi:hypothetical protein
MSDDTSPRAFPCSDPRPGRGGMTLRDYFAAKAMQAAVHNFEHGEMWEGKTFDGKDAARFAYAMADAMVKAREQ